MARLLLWIGIASATVYLVLFGGSWYGIYVPSLRLLSIGLAAAALIVWAGIAFRTPRWRPRTNLLPAIVGALASLTIATVCSSVPRISAEYLGYSIILVALYLLLVRLLADPFYRSRLVALAAVLFAV